MPQVTAAKLYKSASNVDFAILPEGDLTVPSGGDYEQLRFRVHAADQSAAPFTVEARIARSLVATSGWKPLEFLLRAGALVAVWQIEQGRFSDLTPIFHTANTDKTGGLEAALGRWKSGLFEQAPQRRPMGFGVDITGGGPEEPARLSPFPLVTVDYSTVQLTKEQHLYQLGVVIENWSSSSVRGAGVDIWFPSRMVTGAEGFASGLAAKKVRNIECSGFRWRSDRTLFVGDHARVCPTKDVKVGYHMTYDLEDWMDDARPLAQFEVFAGDLTPLRAAVPVRVLQQF